MGFCFIFTKEMLCSSGVKMKGAEVAGRPKRGQVGLKDTSGPSVFFFRIDRKEKKEGGLRGRRMREEGVKGKGHSAL